MLVVPEVLTESISARVNGIALIPHYYTIMPNALNQ